MTNVNDSDCLSSFLSKDLALELLSNFLEFGNYDSVNNLIENKDDKMYEYNYLATLLSRYFILTEDFDVSEKKPLISYLGAMGSLSFFYESDKNSSTIDVLQEEWTSNYEKEEMFLKKEYTKK